MVVWLSSANHLIYFAAYLEVAEEYPDRPRAVRYATSEWQCYEMTRLVYSTSKIYQATATLFVTNADDRDQGDSHSIRTRVPTCRS